MAWPSVRQLLADVRGDSSDRALLQWRRRIRADPCLTAKATRSAGSRKLVVRAGPADDVGKGTTSCLVPVRRERPWTGRGLAQPARLRPVWPAPALPCEVSRSRGAAIPFARSLRGTANRSHANPCLEACRQAQGGFSICMTASLPSLPTST